MKILGHAVRGLALTGNLVVAAGFLLCGSDSYIQPVTHPIWACLELGFPFFLLLNLFFLFFLAGVPPQVCVASDTGFCCGVGTGSCVYSFQPFSGSSGRNPGEAAYL